MKSLRNVTLLISLAGSLPVIAQSGIQLSAIAGSPRGIADAPGATRANSTSLEIPADLLNSPTASHTRFYWTLSSLHAVPDMRDSQQAAPEAALDSGSSGAPAESRSPELRPERKVMNWSYWTVNGALLGASIANAQTLYNCPNCTAVPANLHRPGLLYGAALPVDAGLMYLGYYLKRGGHRWWFGPAVALTAANTYFAHHWAASTN